MALKNSIKKVNIFNEFVSRKKDVEEIIKDMMTKKGYLSWLIYFTQDRSSFTEESLFYLEEDDPNRDFIKRFDLFYKGIEKYAKDNYIYPEHREYGSFYEIKYEDIGFEIGIIRKQGIEYFCKRVPIDNDRFIDFNDIMNNKTQDNVPLISNSLFVFDEMIKFFYENGVPIEAIINSFNNTVNDLKIKDKNAKKRVKKNDDL